MRPVREAAGPTRIRQLNRQAVLHHLRLHGPVSRSELSSALGLSPAGVTAVVNDLLGSGLIRPGPAGGAAARRGRPTAPLALNPDAASALGLRLRPAGGRLLIQRGWIDYAGGFHGLAPLAVARPRALGALLEAIAAATTELAAVVPEPRRILASAIAVPGVVVEGTVRLAPSLPLLEQAGFAAGVAQRVPHAPRILNDVNLSVLAELNAQTRLRARNFAYLYIGAGVGAGIGLQGRLWAASGWAGEVGHIRIDRGGDRRSFEQWLGTERGLAGLLDTIGLDAGDLEGFAALCRRGEPSAVERLDRYAAVLAELVQILNAVLDLDEVIIDFPSAALFECIRPRLARSIARQLRPLVVSVPTRGGETALHGAALAALEQATERVESAPT